MIPNAFIFGRSEKKSQKWPKPCLWRGTHNALGGTFPRRGEGAGRHPPPVALKPRSGPVLKKSLTHTRAHSSCRRNIQQGWHADLEHSIGGHPPAIVLTHKKRHSDTTVDKGCSLPLQEPPPHPMSREAVGNRRFPGFGGCQSLPLPTADPPQHLVADNSVADMADNGSVAHEFPHQVTRLALTLMKIRQLAIPCRKKGLLWKPRRERTISVLSLYMTESCFCAASSSPSWATTLGKGRQGAGQHCCHKADDIMDPLACGPDKT